MKKLFNKKVIAILVIGAILLFSVVYAYQFKIYLIYAKATGKKFKVALVQMPGIKEISEYEKLYCQIDSFMFQAKKENAQIICFPELICCLQKGKYDQVVIASDRLSALCKINQIWGIFGTAHREEDRLYNATYIFDNNGRLVDRYFKHNLLKIEIKDGYSSGVKSSIIETNFGKVGVIICNDMNDLELLAEYKKAKVDVLFIPQLLFVPFPDLRERERTLVVEHFPHALSCQCQTFIGTSMMSGDGNIAQSQLISPMRNESVCAMEEGATGVTIGEVNTGEIRFFEKI